MFMINGNNSYAQSIGTTMQNPDGVFLKEPVPAPDLMEKSITDNGDYSAKADGADGYSSVDVNVANSFTPAEITENNTYDTTNYNSITVNVSGGVGGNIVAKADMYANDCSFYLENENNVIGDSAFKY